MNRIYRPYDSDSDSETDSTGSSVDLPNYHQFALSLASGPSFATGEERLKYEELIIAGPTDISGNNAVLGAPKTKYTKQSVTSLIMLDSRNRDRSVYPQPTACTLRLPRTYKQITQFQVIQVKLLSSFFYFRTDKNNLTITIQEKDRVDATGKPLQITKTIREGTYDIQTLSAEIQLQLNYSPPFYDFINGFADFAEQFIVSGDYSLNFNQPGDSYYDALNNVFINSPTMTQIVQIYFQDVFAGRTSYSINQIKVAYYYPVLFEYILDTKYSGPTVSIMPITPGVESYLRTGEENTYEGIRLHSIYTFEGLDDLIVQDIINRNIPALNAYRLAHTFRNSLINEYKVTYSSNNNRITISSKGLNTSLTNLLTLKANQFQAEQFSLFGINSNAYTLYVESLGKTLSIITNEYFYLQGLFAKYFAVQFNSYSLDYYANVNNQIAIQNGIANTNISATFDSRSIVNNIVPQTINELSSFRDAPTTYWPGLVNLPKPTVSTFYNLNAISTPQDAGDYSKPFNTITNTPDSNAFIDTNGIIYQNPLLKSASIVTPINPTEYTVFTFKSDIRQQLRVASFPRPQQFRYPEYNQYAYQKGIYSSNIAQIFDTSYCFIQNAQNASMDTTTALLTIPGFSNGASNYGVTSNTSLGFWSNTTIGVNVNTNSYFYTFTAPYPSSVGTSTVNYSMDLSVKYADTATYSPLNLFLYHDRAAFMADVYKIRNENPLHYIASNVITGSSNVPLSFTAYANQQYYALLRSASTTFNSVNVTLFPSFSILNPTTLSHSLDTFNPLSTNTLNYTYATANDSNFIRLPTKQLTSNNCVDSNFYSIEFSNIPIGYDSNGISTDLTDYIGFVPQTYSNSYPTSATRIDPITGYIFQVGDGYNSSTGLYIPNTGNAIFVANTQSLYVPTKPPRSQNVICHWYANVFLADTSSEPFVFSTDLSYVFSTDENNYYLKKYNSYPYTQFITRSLPINNLITAKYNNIDQFITLPVATLNNNIIDLSGYDFIDGKLSLGNGIMGISLIPDDGIWDVDKIMLRSAYITEDPLIDRNRGIQYLGIFYSCYLNSINVSQISLSNALMVFELSTIKTYNSNTQNFGFDKVGGTYYEWVKADYATNSNSYLYGFAQMPGTLVPDSNAYYSIVPFTANKDQTTYSYLSGSLTPYPFYSDASANSVYVDGRSTPDGKYVILPINNSGDSNLGPPQGYDYTQSQYELSIPITNSMLQYITATLLCENPVGCKPFSTLNPFGPELFIGITGSPSFSLPNFRVPGYVLFPIGGSFTIYKYDTNVDVRQYSYYIAITPDIFFTSLPNAVLVGMSGNSSSFAFLGLATSIVEGVKTYTFQIETYSIETSRITVTDIITTSNCISVPEGYEIVEVDSFNYNDAGGFTFAYQIGISSAGSYISKEKYCYSKGSPIDDSSQIIYFFKTPVLSTELLQATREILGRFYVAAKTSYATGTTPPSNKYPLRDMLVTYDLYSSNPLYANNGLFYVNPTKLINTATSVLLNIPINIIPIGIDTGLIPNITRINLFPYNTQQSSYFGDITIVQYGLEDKIMLSYDMNDMALHNGSPSKTYYQIASMAYNTVTSSNAYFKSSVQIIKDSSNNILQPSKIVGGGGGYFWILYNEADNSSYANSQYNAIYGNRGDDIDFPLRVRNAYQIFIPTQRIVMTKIGKSYNPMTDISGLTLPEFPHTNMFIYNSYSNYKADIESAKWGQESSSNYMVSSKDFSGYYFNAAALNVPLYPSTTYYLALRGYTPTEKSQVMMRFSLPNIYDFGYLTLKDLSNEIFYATHSPGLFNSNYADVLYEFNTNFIFGPIGKSFGANISLGYSGITLSNINGFGDFMSNFTGIYTIYNSNVTVVNTINSNVSSNIQNFINTDLSYIIPLSASNRERYTNPLTYSILWKSALPSQYASLVDNWGLGWNLGYAKMDTSFNTTHVAESFYKILDDYINLRLNTEYDLNRMDTGAQEDLSITQDTTGSLKAYYAKLLLAPFGSYAQTLIYNPITLNIPIPKIDKLSFTWMDNIGQVINNNDCEWNIVVQIIENADIITPGLEGTLA